MDSGWEITQDAGSEGRNSGSDLSEADIQSYSVCNGILCYNRHRDPAKPYDALRVCAPAVKLEEVFKICHEGVAGTLDKFQRTFFVMSAHEKIHRLVDRCNTCLAKERSI